MILYTVNINKAEITDKKIICNKQYINTSINNDISLVPWKRDEVIVDSSVLRKHNKIKITNTKNQKRLYLQILQIM